MITKFDEYIKESLQKAPIVEEIEYLLKNHFDINAIFKTDKFPMGLTIEFPAMITTKEPWFFKVLQLARHYSYAANINKNKIELRRKKTYDE